MTENYLLTICNYFARCKGRIQRIKYWYFKKPPQLSGFICAYHPADPGSNPKYNINICDCNEKRTKINKGRLGLAKIFLCICTLYGQYSKPTEQFIEVKNSRTILPWRSAIVSAYLLRPGFESKTQHKYGFPFIYLSFEVQCEKIKNNHKKRQRLAHLKKYWYFGCSAFGTCTYRTFNLS